MKKIIFFAVAISLFAIHGCQKDPVAPINEIKIVDNLSISAIEANISGSFECPVAISKIELWIDSIESSTNPQKHAVSIDNKNISLSVAPLYPGTTYYYRYVAYNEIDTLEMEEKSFTTEDGTLAAITTSDLTQIGAYSAVGGGNVSSDGYFEVTERGVCWSTSPNPTTDNNKTIDGEGIGSFSSNITNLSLNTTYYVRAYATNAKGTVYGEQKMFTTNSNEITVKTSSVYNITANTATCGGEVSTEGTQGITARGVCWSTASNPTIANNKTIDGSGSGVFLSNITGLAGNTKYYVRAYATNSTGTVYGEEISFTTTTIPTVFTNTVTSIKATTLVCGGNVTSDGNATVTERGLCWSTSPNPTINGNKTSSGTGTGSFSITITGLNENTTYYIRAYATNSNGTAYGDTRTAQTQSTSIPSVTTANATSITANSAVCGGNVTSDGYSTVTARGVCWSTSPNPTINDSKTTNGTGTGSFTSNITGLSQNTTYYVRAYATNSIGTAYGEEKSFTTSYDWVDLGLPSGLKWATCNVGATTPEGYGNFYAWGETTTKASYYDSNSVTYGQQISDFSGNATYDAARANWGSTWRMPTKAEMQELKIYCTWTWTTQSGVNGMRVTGPNGNSIFLPAAGEYSGSFPFYVGVIGLYWSSTPHESDTSYAFYLDFNSGGDGAGWSFRYSGHMVRPVSY